MQDFQKTTQPLTGLVRTKEEDTFELLYKLIGCRASIDNGVKSKFIKKLKISET